MGLIADGDDQVGKCADRRQSPRGRAREVEPGTRRRGDGTGMHPPGWVRAGRHRRCLRHLLPQRRRQLTASRVAGAHEQRPSRRDAPTGHEPVEGFAEQMHVPPTTVAARTRPPDHPDPLEDIEVMRQQVRRDPHQPPQLQRRAVRDGQLVHQRQPHGIGERAMTGSPIGQGGRGHDIRLVTRPQLTQSFLSDLAAKCCTGESGVESRCSGGDRRPWEVHRSCHGVVGSGLIES